MARTRLRVLTLIVLLLFLGLLAALRYNRQQRMVGLRKESMEFQGMERTYFIHVPNDTGASKSLPLVFAFHGRLGTGDELSRHTHLNEIADRHHFIVLYPNGYEHSWADGRGKTAADLKSVDDIGFVKALIEKVKGEFPIDSNRMYATGISNGGFFSERIACELSDRFAAIGIVAATLSEQLARVCKPARPISVLVMMGTNDPLVPFEGGEMKSGNQPKLLSAHDTLENWAHMNGCNGTPEQTKISANVQRQMYTSCNEKTKVGLYTIQGGGHTWPGGSQYLPEFIVGKTNRDIDAGEVFANFFESAAR